MKTKQIIVTPNGNPNSIWIAKVQGTNKETNKEGFIVYGFKANQPEPVDTSNGELLIDTLFEIEIEALKNGEKIVKAQVKADLDRYKKAIADQNRASKKRK